MCRQIGHSIRYCCLTIRFYNSPVWNSIIFFLILFSFSIPFLCYSLSLSHILLFFFISSSFLCICHSAFVIPMLSITQPDTMATFILFFVNPSSHHLLWCWISFHFPSSSYSSYPSTFSLSLCLLFFFYHSFDFSFLSLAFSFISRHISGEKRMIHCVFPWRKYRLLYKKTF